MINQLINACRAKGRPGVGILFVSLSVALFIAITFFHQKTLFDNLSIGSRDLSFFTQSLWNFIHGNGLRTTIGWYGNHLMSEHFYLTHVLWSAVYFFWTSPYALFFIQGAMLGLSGVALYRIARIKGLGVSTSILLMGLLLCHPSFHGASSGINLYGYHPDCLFPVFFLFAYDAHLRKRKAAFWILVLMALGTLEQAAIVLSALAIYWMLAGDRKVGLGLLATSVVWYVAATKIAMPLIGGGTPYYFSALKKPESLTALLSVILPAFNYGTKMLLYWGALPLLSSFSLVAVPSILIYAQAYSVGYGIPLNVLSWHAVPIVSVLAVGSVQGILFLSKRFGSCMNWIRAGLAICCCVLAWISFDEVYDSKVSKISAEQRFALRQLKEEIPEQASLSANFFVASHFSNRKNLFIFPKIADADYVLINKNEKFQFDGSEPEVLRELQKNKSYFLVYDRAGFLMYRMTRK
jgi:uncharacterized membrane protein